MKKTAVAILSVAILGTLAFFVNKDKAPSSLKDPVSPPAVNNQKIVQPALDSSAVYHDGSYTGKIARTPFGKIQVSILVSGGKIVDVTFLNMPGDQNYSQELTNSNEALLKEATLFKQSADIATVPDFVSGATSTVKGYQESLQAALDKAAS